jgi:hypothetical protein
VLGTAIAGWRHAAASLKHKVTSREGVSQSGLLEVAVIELAPIANCDRIDLRMKRLPIHIFQSVHRKRLLIQRRI